MDWEFVKSLFLEILKHCQEVLARKAVLLPAKTLAMQKIVCVANGQTVPETLGVNLSG